MTTMTKTAVTIYWDTDSDPSNPGWVVRWDEPEHDQRHLTAALDTLDREDVEGARAEAAVYLDVEEGLVTVIS